MTEAPTEHRPGTPCWVNLLVRGLATTQDFYGALFGWTFVPGPRQLGSCIRAFLNGRVVAGIGVLPPDRRLPTAWTTYFTTDDVDATAERIRWCGGTVGVGPLGEEGTGRLVIASDPMGAVFGTWQSGEHQAMQPGGEPGTPVWNELLTQDTTIAGKFYTDVFGYEAKNADHDNLTLHLDGRAVAAIHGMGPALMHDRGPHWMTYFQVADIDDAVRHVVELGGDVIRPLRESLIGREATVADPEGAVFTVVQP